MKVPKSTEDVGHSSSLLLETHGFPQCLGAIDGTHVEVIEILHCYTDYIKQKRLHLNQYTSCVRL